MKQLNDTHKGIFEAALSSASFGLIPLFTLPVLQAGLYFGSRSQAPEGFWLAHSTNEVVSHLNEEGKQNLLVEGAHTLQSFIAAELWDVTRMKMTSNGGAVASPAPQQ